ncbi:unnamed protein product [Arabidopsis arenosa]|uniref:RING-type domain-containing protein n=1 Tax=Arabidopsis arenosa TaxID=38785 RepID=A0A8S2AF50_ARAAE|nr:unnamed protein product [Arabidopsis arenosa]
MDNQEEEPKQPPNKLPDLTLFEQANSEIALAASQAISHFAPSNHDSASSRLSMIESDEESEDEDEEEESNENYYEYLDSNGFGVDDDEINEFLEDQESNSNLEEDDFLEEEDEVDPDQLSYEELIALGDFIGVEKRGMTPTEISTCLKASTYIFSHNKNEIDRCVVCQMEFEERESLVVLRPCDHPYHSECITKWLETKKICPICCSEPSVS